MEGQPLKSGIESKKQIEQEKFRQEIGKFFDTYKSGQERFDIILLKVDGFIKVGILDKEKFVSILKKYSECEDRNEFIDGILVAVEPILETMKTNPRLIEQLQAEAFVEQGHFTRLNEVLSYGVAGDSIHIHFAPAKELMKEKGIKGSINLVSGGLKKLAKIVEANEKIKSITATSWIVAEHPKIMESLGFTIVGPISEEHRNKHWRGDKREISEAEISRENFLAKYLSK